ncbi:transglycosylase SLT domain-containing protein [Shewanella marina]|uniref:transglycosylase SLT domain-containing protein n=1 Tax=Shewanella marina TaxID=487319 RepID=UPI0004701911|nr:transglycosylase SLT domain-containing protein [Shewanella marina]
MNKFRKSIVFLAINLLLVANVSANDPFTNLDNEVAKLSIDDSIEFDQWYANHINEFAQWQKIHLNQWDKEQQSSIVKWGDSKTSSQDMHVINNKNNTSRTVIDFKNNEIIINVKINEADETNIQQKQIAVQNVISSNKKLWSEVGLAESVFSKMDSVAVVDVLPENSVLEDIKNKIQRQTEQQMSQLDIFMEQENISIDESSKQKVLSQQKQIMSKEQGNRIKKHTKNFEQAKNHQIKKPIKLVQYKVSIPKTAISERAKNYIPHIDTESIKQNLPSSLILAIMHTESHFNPNAKSHVPAYGLMQIVPNTAGHDVNKLYRGKDSPMTATELYDPKVNIETGTAYLKILQSRYLKGINDPQSAMYSIISAYNTGSGNVAKAFGSKSVNAAINKINKMNSDQVYQQLITNLPYEETRNYLQKVNKRLQQYNKSYQQSAL